MVVRKRCTRNWCWLSWTKSNEIFMCVFTVGSFCTLLIWTQELFYLYFGWTEVLRRLNFWDLAVGLCSNNHLSFRSPIIFHERSMDNDDLAACNSPLCSRRRIHAARRRHQPASIISSGIDVSMRSSPFSRAKIGVGTIILISTSAAAKRRSQQSTMA